MRRSIARLVGTIATAAMVTGTLVAVQAPNASANTCPSGVADGPITVNGVAGCQVVITSQTVGGGTWQVPAGVTTIDVVVAGAGGGGGGGWTGNAGGAGGGGGQVVVDTDFAVTPLANITISLGSGGQGGGATQAGGSGTSSSFGTITAQGGIGGAPATGSAGGAGGASAQIVEGTTTSRSGGASGIDGRGAGGGAGAAANGSNAGAQGAGGAGGAGLLASTGLFAADFGIPRIQLGAGGGGGGGTGSNSYTPASGGAGGPSHIVGGTSGGQGAGSGSANSSIGTYASGGGGGSTNSSTTAGSYGADGMVVIRWLWTSVPALVNKTPGNAITNQPFSYTFTATGTPAPTFSVFAGTLPAGLALSSAGVLSGTPTGEESASFTVKASNSAGDATETLTMIVGSVPVFTASNPPTTGLPNVAYTAYSFAASGYPVPTYATQTGSLPPGLTLSSAGSLSGTPTTAGSYTFTVRATNTLGTADTSSISITVGTAPVFTADSPPAVGVKGSAYGTYTFSASGNPTPTFAKQTGSLPPGVSLASNGVLSGTPTSAGYFTFTVRATNAVGTVDSPSITITVTRPTPPPVPAPGPGSHGFAWGGNSNGVLGIGSVLDQPEPIEIVDGANATGEWTSLAGGYYSSCGIDVSANAYCWGRNSSGALGDGTQTDSYVPVAVVDGANAIGTWKVIGVGGGDNWACGLNTIGKAFCWGANGSDSYLGSGNGTPSSTPVAVVNGANAVGTWSGLSVGYYHSCALGTDSKAYCWGYGSGGALGNNSTSSSNSPVAVSNGANLSGVWKSISAGYYSACGIGSDDKAYCWGAGSYGQLGNGASAGELTPVAVVNGENSSGTWKALAVGYYRACGIGFDDRAYCWGYYPSGYGTTTVNVPKAVAIPGANPVTSLASGTYGYSSCAVAGTDVYCWGSGDVGQLGDGMESDSAFPVQVVKTGALAAGTPVSVSMGGKGAFLVATWPRTGPSPTPDNGGSTPSSTPSEATPTSASPSKSNAEPLVDPLDPIGSTRSPNIASNGMPAGQSLLLVDGQPAPVTVKPNAASNPTSLLVDAPGLTMTLQGRDDINDPLGLTSQQALILQSEQTLRSRSLFAARKTKVQPAAVSSGTGFRPNSVVKFYILPGTYLGELPVDASGKYEGRVPVTAGLPAGVHTLQVNGYAPDGSVRSLSLGVLVKSSGASVRTVRASTTVRFAASSPVLTAQGKAALRALVKKTGKAPITVASLGYVQKSGSGANDQALSTARARAVGAYLRSLGVTGNYTVRGDGVGGPGAANRKVDVTVTYRK